MHTDNEILFLKCYVEMVSRSICMCVRYTITLYIYIFFSRTYSYQVLLMHTLVFIPQTILKLLKFFIQQGVFLLFFLFVTHYLFIPHNSLRIQIQKFICTLLHITFYPLEFTHTTEIIHLKVCSLWLPDFLASISTASIFSFFLAEYSEAYMVYSDHLKILNNICKQQLFL